VDETHYDFKTVGTTIVLHL